MNSKLASLEVQNEEGEYIIPAELYAISKENRIKQPFQNILTGKKRQKDITNLPNGKEIKAS